MAFWSFIWDVEADFKMAHAKHACVISNVTCIAFIWSIRLRMFCV